MKKKSKPSLSYNMKLSGLLSIFVLFVEKRFRQTHFHNLIWKLLIVVPFATKNSIVFRDALLEIAGNVRLVRIQSIWIIIVPIVVVHFNNGKNWVQNVVYISNERNGTSCSSSTTVASLFASASSLCSFFYFFRLICFKTTTLDKFLFPSQLRLP